jgi:hypothetical protein
MTSGSLLKFKMDSPLVLTSLPKLVKLHIIEFLTFYEAFITLSYVSVDFWKLNEEWNYFIRERIIAEAGIPESILQNVTVQDAKRALVHLAN